ncbi:MAG: hypothetical protein OHK0029_34770 [Armatimonadaceae bacterium]
MKQRLSLFATLSIILLFAALAYAVQGVGKEVRFPKGKSAATYVGRIPATDVDYDAYILRARARQTLSVSLTSKDPAAHLIVYSLDRGPTDDQIAPAKPGVKSIRKWSGKLPEAGSYSVQVYGKRPRTPYSLTVSIR